MTSWLLKTRGLAYLGIVHFVIAGSLLICLLGLLIISALDELIVYNKYDWPAINQFTLVTLFSLNLIMAYASSWLNCRRCLLLSILLYFSYLVHAGLLYTTDPRPVERLIIRRGRNGTLLPDKEESFLLLLTPRWGPARYLRLATGFLMILEWVMLNFSYGLGRYSALLSVPEPGPD